MEKNKRLGVKERIDVNPVPSHRSGMLIVTIFN